MYNRVVTKKYYLSDIYRSDHEPQYKQELVSTVRDAVTQGDVVVEIGAGFGVCTVWLAREVGTEGRVFTYEASADQVAVTREALTLNGYIHGENLRERVTVQHTVVGTDKKIYGQQQNASIVAPEALPESDVFVTDCEGAELPIIKDLPAGNHPQTFIVETHPDFGSPTDELTGILSERGYDCRTIHVTDTDAGPKHILIGKSL